MSANDPKRTCSHSANASICIRLSIVVNRRRRGDMQRRGESKQPTKGQRTSGPEARKAPTARVSTAGLRQQVAALTRELKEAREQQTATSEVLQVISQSAGELESVFKAMLENATHICDASYGVMFLCEGKGFRTAATYNLPRAFAEERQRVALI